MLTPSSNNIPYFDTLYQIKSGTPSGEKLLNNNKMESKKRELLQIAIARSLRGAEPLF
jgi:hypothetical protein